MGVRKPYGVWMLLQSGEPWMFCCERTLDEALLTARTLRGAMPLFPDTSVWIASPPVIGEQQWLTKKKGVA
jgi:hypothetical protein